MTTVVRSNRHDLPESEVAKKKRPTDQGLSPFSHQMNIRVPDDLYAVIEETAAALGLDATNLVRMVLRENIGPYKQRADKARDINKKCSTPHE